MKFRPFLYLLLFEIIAIVIIFLMATQQQSGGEDVEFIVRGIEYLIKFHIIAIFILVLNYRWAKRNMAFVIVCFLIGLTSFVLKLFSQR